MIIRNTISGVAAGAALALIAAAPASAAVVFTSQLQYEDKVSGVVSPSFGTVTITQTTADELTISVTLASGDLFINSGGPHDPFTFNTLHDDDVGNFTLPVFSDGGHGSFAISGFGTMTDRIDYSGSNGGVGHGNAGPLSFTISDSSGITFAGIGYQTNAAGKVTVQGSGEHLTSNSDGWWFTADIYDAATGNTYNVGAKDAFGPCQGTACAVVTPGVPEPATWGLMILGFGAAGAALRRRRAAVATVA
jgi:hypothetical protein